MLCAKGRVTRHGTAEVLRDSSARVAPEEILLDGSPLDFPLGLAVLLHKPLGYVCSHAGDEGPLVYDLLPPRWLQRDPPVTTAGRLDKDTSGLVVVTDLGDLVHQLTSPRARLEKEYVAELDKPIDDSTVTAFAAGLRLKGEDKPTAPATLTALGDAQASVTLREGRYHQVRRMFAACGFHVRALRRVRIGSWTLDGLAEGTWRPLPNWEA